MKHLLKITWSRKRSNFFLLFEIGIVFFVLTFFFYILTNMYKDYWKPTGFSEDIQNIYAITASYPSSKRRPKQQPKNMANITRVKKNLLDMPQVETVSLSARSQPYTAREGFGQDVNYNGKYVPAHRYWVDDDFVKIVELPMLAGEWFNMKNNNHRLPPMILTEALADSLFQGESAIGKVVTRSISRGGSEAEFVVVGICGEYRTGEFSKPQASFFTRNDPKGRRGPGVRSDVNGMFMWGDASIMVKIKPEALAFDIEEKLVRTAQKSISADQKGNWSFYIYSLQKYRRAENAKHYETTFQYFLIMAFLLINVALGFLGIIYHGITKRRSEIGIRRAIGSTKRKVYSLILSEALLVSILGIISGAIFSMQLWIFRFVFIETDIFLKAVLLSIGTILIVVILASMFPAIKGAKINAAIALKDE